MPCAQGGGQGSASWLARPQRWKPGLAAAQHAEQGCLVARESKGHCLAI